MSAVHHPIIIDVEASGFGSTSYPIEVGLAMEGDQKFCSLILPAPDWTHWDEEAEKVHQIDRNTLEVHGKSPKQVATRLNEILKGKTVYTDGWVVDKPWIITLFYVAGIKQDFEISSLEMILSEGQMKCWHVTREKVIQDLDVVRHRASGDAMIIRETYMRTLNKIDKATN